MTKPAPAISPDIESRLRLLEANVATLLKVATTAGLMAQAAEMAEQLQAFVITTLGTLRKLQERGLDTVGRLAAPKEKGPSKMEEMMAAMGAAMELMKAANEDGAAAAVAPEVAP